MASRKPPKCSRCKGNEVVLAYSASEYPPQSVSWPGKPVTTQSVYSCKCGHVFTITIHHGCGRRREPKAVALESATT